LPQVVIGSNGSPRLMKSGHRNIFSENFFNYFWAFFIYQDLLFCCFCLFYSICELKCTSNLKIHKNFSFTPNWTVCSSALYIFESNMIFQFLILLRNSTTSFFVLFYKVHIIVNKILWIKIEIKQWNRKNKNKISSDIFKKVTIMHIEKAMNFWGKPV
jgi:hypothetical protein